ncbi:MAG: helix-turn-helix transcriptional regulator [Atopobiaceae bacterium]|jgi:putative transcriptional regulator|nr:helix-turn-helix transcriptional regulator [Atopobiaceae bacterium]
MRSLKELRDRKGMTQETIARYLGITRQTYAKYEQEPEKLTIDQAIVLCDILDCDFDSLLSKEDN